MAAPVTDRSDNQEADRRVVPFRARRGRVTGTPETTADDLARYEAGNERDDYRQRMIVNLLAFGFTGALIAGGIWIVISLADTRKRQDCVLSGRSNCDMIAAPPMERY